MAVTDSNFKLKYLDPSQWNLWDSFVRNSQQGTVFQSSDYIHSVTSAFRRLAKILVVFRADQLVGGVVLYPKKKWGVNYVTSPFFIPYNGFIIDCFQESRFYYRRIRLQQKVLELLQNEIEKQFASTELCLSPHLEDFRSLIWNDWKFFPQYSINIPLQIKDFFSTPLEE